MKTTQMGLLLGLPLGFPSFMYSQGTTGKFSGVVTDKSDAVI